MEGLRGSWGPYSLSWALAHLQQVRFAPWELPTSICTKALGPLL